MQGEHYHSFCRRQELRLNRNDLNSGSIDFPESFLWISLMHSFHVSSSKRTGAHFVVTSIDEAF